MEARQVVAVMEAGGSCCAVAAIFEVTPSTAGNWHRQYRHTQSCSLLAIGSDQRWKLSGERGWIAQRLEVVADQTLAEGRNELAVRGVIVSYAGVQWMVKRKPLTKRTPLWA